MLKMENVSISSSFRSHSSSLTGFDLTKFLSKMQLLKGTYKGKVHWCNDLPSADWKTHLLEITESGSLTQLVDSQTLKTLTITTEDTEEPCGSVDSFPIVEHLQNCKLQLIEDRSCLFPIIEITGKSKKVYLRVNDEIVFESLLCSLLWWSALKSNGIFNKFSVEAPTLNKEEKEPTTLLVSQLWIFGPLPKAKPIPVIRHLTRPNFLPKVNLEEGWFPAMGMLKSNGTLDLLLQSDGSLIYSLDITMLLRSEIRLIDPSLQIDNYLFLGILPNLREELNISSKRNLVSNGLFKKHNPNLILKFPLMIDAEDWLVVLQSFALAERLSLIGSHASNKLRVSNRFQIAILEGNFKNEKYNSLDLPPSLYIDLSIWGCTWARTPVVKETYLPFWREEFTFNESVKINNLRIEVKQKHPQPNKEDEILGFIEITQEMINDASLNKETRIPVMDIKNTRFKLGTICIRITSCLNFVLPSANYSKLETALSEVSLSDITTYFRDLSASCDSKFDNISTVFLDIFQSLGREDAWFAALIDKELSDVDGSITRNMINNKTSTHIYNTLFRGNSVLTKSLEKYFYRVGKEYLDKSIGSVLRDIIRSKKSCELDPARINVSGSEEMQATLAANRARLLRWVEIIWGMLYQTSNDLPMLIKTQMKTFRNKLELICVEEEGNMILNSISGMLFLRFFCPVILNPKLFNFVQSHLDDTSRRTLTLICKVILNLSNVTTFGNKESFMIEMNTFIEAHKEELLDYIDKITQKKLDFSPKILKLTSSVPRPSLVMNEQALADLPTNPYLIDRCLRETELFTTVATFAIKRDGDSQILKSISLEHISKNSASLDASMGAQKPQIGELEFEKITDNNTEVFGDDLMKYLEEDECITFEENGEVTAPSPQRSSDMIKQIEQESLLLFHKMERLKQMFSDYEYPPENVSGGMEYSIFLAENAYYYKDKKIVIDTNSDTAQEDGRKKLFDTSKGNSTLLENLMPQLSSHSSESMSFLSISESSSGMRRSFSILKSTKIHNMIKGHSEDNVENGQSNGLKGWFRKRK